MNDLKIVYLDTNIYSYLARNRNIWSKFLEYLKSNKYCIALSGADIYELIEAERLCDSIIELSQYFPTWFIKNWDDILREEIESHPNFRKFTILTKQIKNKWDVESYLRNNDLKKIRASHPFYAEQVPILLDKLKSNFPLSRNGKYTISQGAEFADYTLIQELGHFNIEFLKKFEDNVIDLKTEIFSSYRISALVIFYKYYLGGRKPNKHSDFGDLMHLYALPYCHLAIFERDLCNILNMIKTHEDILVQTEIRNIDFLKELEE